MLVFQLVPRVITVIQAIVMYMNLCAWNHTYRCTKRNYPRWSCV